MQFFKPGDWSWLLIIYEAPSGALNQGPYRIHEIPLMKAEAHPNSNSARPENDLRIEVFRASTAKGKGGRRSEMYVTWV